MPTLASLQAEFQNYLLKNQEDIKKSIKETEALSINQRLDIYQDAYQSRLVEALASNFPILNTCLGFTNFNQLCRAYIEEYPSRYRSIRWYGDDLASYLKENDGSYLAELANFEWHMSLAFDSPDAKLLSLEEIAQIPPESFTTLKFQTLPSLCLLTFNWNVIDIWEALTNKKHPPELQAIAPLCIVLWRRDYLNRFYSLKDDEAFALKALKNGKNFGEICMGLGNWFTEEELSLRAATLLKAWIQAGMITKLIAGEAE